MHLDTILGLITERETAARRAADQIRAQIAAMTSELARLDAELADLTTTCNTLHALAAAEFTQMTVERVGGGSRRQDAVELVAALFGDAAGRQVVDLVEKLEAFQAVGSEGVERPGSESFRAREATPRPRACAAVQ